MYTVLFVWIWTGKYLTNLVWFYLFIELNGYILVYYVSIFSFQCVVFSTF